MPLFSLVDTHCHLTYGDLEKDAVMAWERARAAGVTQAIVVGVDAENSEVNARFVRDREGLFATAGIHPNETSKAGDSAWRIVESLARATKVVALGETGLDFYRDWSPPKTQEEFLERHAELAHRCGLPLVLHIRDAFPRIREVLAPHVPRGLRAVLHCFGGGAGDIEPFVSWGWMISFSGILTYPKAPEILKAARRTPLPQCLIETDAPWLAPVPHRGDRNEPAFVVHTAQALASAKGLPFEEVATATTENARRFFGLDRPTRVAAEPHRS
jgi:TatD DNase family protein